MYPIQHLALGTLFALFIFALFPQISLIGVLLIIASTVLIDMDHYIYYIIKKRNFNILKARKWFFNHEKIALTISREERNKTYPGFYFLHGI